MRKITALTALLALSFAIPTAHSGDRSGLEPQRSGGSQSFTPPITPPVTGTPGPDKYLQTNGAGFVSWAAKPTEITDRVSPTAGVVRIIQLVFPQSGPGQWRIYGAEW